MMRMMTNDEDDDHTDEDDDEDDDDDAHYIAGLRGSLSRLQLDYVDIVFANRNDVNSPMEGQS